MKSKHLVFLLLLTIMSCVTIPKETITLSQTLGGDLKTLQTSHTAMVSLYYGKIKENINTFVEDVYAPFVIHYVLKGELAKFQQGEPSLYGTIEQAGKTDGKTETEAALKEMTDFQEAANRQITKKRNELLDPIEKQEAEVLSTINQSYQNAIYANSTLTGYLQSVYKVKKSQSEALSLVGLQGVDTTVTKTLVKASDAINTAIEKGKEIDVKSDDAYNKIKELTDKIKELINK